MNIAAFDKNQDVLAQNIKVFQNSADKSSKQCAEIQSDLCSLTTTIQEAIQSASSEDSDFRSQLTERVFKLKEMQENIKNVLRNHPRLNTPKQLVETEKMLRAINQSSLLKTIDSKKEIEEQSEEKRKIDTQTTSPPSTASISPKEEAADKKPTFSYSTVDDIIGNVSRYTQKSKNPIINFLYKRVAALVLPIIAFYDISKNLLLTLAHACGSVISKNSRRECPKRFTATGKALGNFGIHYLLVITTVGLIAPSIIFGKRTASKEAVEDTATKKSQADDPPLETTASPGSEASKAEEERELKQKNLEAEKLQKQKNDLIEKIKTKIELSQRLSSNRSNSTRLHRKKAKKEERTKQLTTLIQEENEKQENVQNRMIEDLIEITKGGGLATLWNNLFLLFQKSVKASPIKSWNVNPDTNKFTIEFNGPVSIWSNPLKMRGGLVISCDPVVTGFFRDGEMHFTQDAHGTAYALRGARTANISCITHNSETDYLSITGKVSVFGRSMSGTESILLETLSDNWFMEGEIVTTDPQKFVSEKRRNR